MLSELLCKPVLSRKDFRKLLSGVDEKIGWYRKRAGVKKDATADERLVASFKDDDQIQVAADTFPPRSIGTKVPDLLHIRVVPEELEGPLTGGLPDLVPLRPSQNG